MLGSLGLMLPETFVLPVVLGEAKGGFGFVHQSLSSLFSPSPSLRLSLYLSISLYLYLSVSPLSVSLSLSVAISLSLCFVCSSKLSIARINLFSLLRYMKNHCMPAFHCLFVARDLPILAVSSHLPLENFQSI